MDVSTLERHALALPRKPLTLKDALLSVSDFRIDRRKKYPLYEILMIAVCAMVAGAKGPTDFERFGRLKLRLLKKFLPLQNGIPSHDTFRRVLGKLDPKRFNAALVKWLESVSDVTGDVISVDGKLLRRALTKDGKMPCIVSAYSKRSKLVMGQVKADEKSNEITAIPGLLDLLYLKGAIVTIDAAGCQKKIVKKIVKRGAGYVISLKGNQSTMHDEIRAFMQDPAFMKKFKKAKTVDKGHGRVETRTCWQTDDIGWFEDKDKWAGLRSVCMVESKVYDMATKETTRETRFFISSLPVDPKRALEAIRAHWGVEAMHWTLDMDFDEDRSRARTEDIAENLAMLRHVVINVLRLDKSLFGGISVKRKELTWDDDKLLKLMLAA
ncbi:MAG: ISAs1 family transposase [Kiritimatiellae bacterium]|nr:ISAs1 family transposase [Kiritimatiellia bacterium]